MNVSPASIQTALNKIQQKGNHIIQENEVALIVQVK